MTSLQPARGIEWISFLCLLFAQKDRNDSAVVATQGAATCPNSNCSKKYSGTTVYHLTLRTAIIKTYDLCTQKEKSFGIPLPMPLEFR